MIIFKTVLNSVLLSGLLYAGLFMNIEWALNVGLFLVWLIIILGFFACCLFSLFLLADDTLFKKEIKSEVYETTGFMKYINRFIAVCNIGMLVASGYFVAGALWAFVMITINVLRLMLKEKAKRLGGVGDATET